MTELYDAEHNISRGDDDLDRARAGALLAAEQRGSGWGRPSDSDGNPRYDEIIDLLMNQVGRMLDELSVELGSHENKPPAASNEFIDELVIIGTLRILQARTEPSLPEQPRLRDFIIVTLPECAPL